MELELRASFIFYSSYYEAISELPDEEQGQIYKAIIDYGIAKIEPTNLTPAGRMCFKLIKPTIDSALSKYDANVKNGVKGGRPKGSKNTATQKPSTNPTITQKEPTKNPNKTQSKPNTNPTIIHDKSETKPNQNLDIDIEYNNLVSKLVKKNNKINNPGEIFNNYSHSCARVRPRSESERKPYIDFFKDFFEWQHLDSKWLDAGFEIVDTMIEAFEVAKSSGLKFNHKTYSASELATKFVEVDVEQFRAIVTQLVLNSDIDNRPFYVLGCIFNSAQNKQNRMSQEDMEKFIEKLEV